MGTIAVSVALVDGLAVGVVQAIPETGIALANVINFQSNALGNRTHQAIYTNLSSDKLSASQRKRVSFKDNSYVTSMSSITNHTGNTSGLFLQGYIAVPNLGISEPIYYGTSDDSLGNGVGTAKDGQIMGQGNYGVSGHNMGQFVNWKVPVPSISGGYINPGSYFTALQDKTPTDIYMTDGKNIYKYKEMDKSTTNVGNGHVLDDDYPHGSKTYSYPLRNSQDASTGATGTSKGLGLGDKNNANQSVGSYKFSSLVNDTSSNATYVIKYKTNYKYADSLKKDNFKIDVTSDGIKISGVKATIVDATYKNGEMAVSFKLKGDVSDAASTIGSRIILTQLQNSAYVTLTTCIILPDGTVSANRMIHTGELVSVTKFKDAPYSTQVLFPAVLKGNANTVSADKGVKSLPKIKLTLVQKVIYLIGNSILKQSEWLTHMFGRN